MVDVVEAQSWLTSDMASLTLCCPAVRVEENKRPCTAGAACDARAVWPWSERPEDLAYWLVSTALRPPREDVELPSLPPCLSCGLSPSFRSRLAQQSTVQAGFEFQLCCVLVEQLYFSASVSSSLKWRE